MIKSQPKSRLSQVLHWIGISTSSGYYQQIPPEQQRKRGPVEKPIDAELLEAVKSVAEMFPMWGYKRITIVCRRQEIQVGKKMVYRIFKLLGLLQKPRPRAAELYQAAKLFELLPRRPFLVTDNGTSFLAKRFQEFICDDFQHVRIQYRTPTQLGLLERFHKTLKNKEVYWQLYENFVTNYNAKETLNAIAALRKKMSY